LRNGTGPDGFLVVFGSRSGISHFRRESVGLASGEGTLRHAPRERNSRHSNHAGDVLFRRARSFLAGNGGVRAGLGDAPHGRSVSIVRVVTTPPVASLLRFNPPAQEFSQGEETSRRTGPHPPVAVRKLQREFALKFTHTQVSSEEVLVRVSLRACSAILVKLLGDMGDHDPCLAEGVAIDHRHSVRLKIHPLRHVEVTKGIAGKRIDREVQVKGISISLPAGCADDASTRRGVMVGVDASHEPRAVRFLPCFEFEILLEAEPLTVQKALCLGM
jgi:hypothetical protein